MTANHPEDTSKHRDNTTALQRRARHTILRGFNGGPLPWVFVRMSHVVHAQRE